MEPIRQRSVPVEPVILEARVVCGSGGGPDKTILNSPRHLWSAGYRTVCAYMHPPGDTGFEELRRKAEAAQAPLVSVHDRGPWDWRVVSQYLQLCRRERVAIWHGHDYKSNALGLIVARFWPMRLVTTVHGWGVQRTRRTILYYAIDRACLPHYESVICVSKDLYARARTCGVSANRCLLIENAIDSDQFSRTCGVVAAKQRLGLSPERTVIGAVGRLSSEKGFDILIRAAHQIVQTGHNLELVIAGEGDFEADLRSLIDQLDMGNRVRLLGYRADTRAVYEALDLFVLSSLREGLPNVLLEAMSMQVPVVATRVGGVPRLVKDGVNGLLVESGNVEALVNGLGQLLGSPDLRTRLGSAGHQTVEANFSFSARMAKVRAVYDRLLDRAPATPKGIPATNVRPRQ